MNRHRSDLAVVSRADGGIVVPPMESSKHSIGTRTVRGMLWAYGSFVGGRLLSLIATAILARVLVPEEFGLVALALTLMALLEGIADLGLSQALVIQDDEVVEQRAETVFASSVLLGLVASILIAIAGPFAARFFDQPDLAPIAIVLGLNFFLRSLGSTHYAIALRDLNIRTRTIAEFGDVFVRGVVGIVLALAGMGAWSLVGGYLAGTLALVVVLWVLIPWRPKLTPNLEDLRRMLRFGTTISGVNIVAAMIANVDYLFIGRVLGATSLGLYTLGFRLPELLIVNLSAVASDVLFPAFSAIDRGSLARAFLISLRYTMLVAVPIAVGLATLAEPIVISLFGGQWVDSIAPMQILTIYAFAVTVGIPAGTAYKATGRAGVLLNLGLARLGLVVVALLLFADRGIVAVAASQAVVAGSASIVGILLASRLLDVHLKSILGSIWPAVCGGLLMAAPMVAVEILIAQSWVAMLTGGFLGVAVYTGFLYLVVPDTLSFIKEKLLPGSAPPSEDPLRTRETDVIA